MVKIDDKKYDYRRFKVVKATSISNKKGKYKVDDSQRSQYIIKKKKGETDWPAVTQAAKKAFGVMCTSDNCKKTFVLRETTQGRPKKLWFFKGEAAPISKADQNKMAKDILKKNPKSTFVKDGRIPTRDTSNVKLVDNEKLGHANPLRDWK